MKDDVIINKIETIKRCIKRIEEEYANKPSNLENYTKQDSIILNLQRMCEATLDLGLHYIKIKKLEIPQTSKQIFEVLEKNGVIDKKTSVNMQGMVGFRNIAVHDYQSLNIEILQKIIEKHLGDSLIIAKKILED
ncbi:type VII toxin-antitoxin system HepT family RNase toxin [Cetobacterium sp.]|uniref:type VII toxin-antitoxin system HepT family RNase toxin n=1 Tax=Cetobacterium sp. TaxID=2071632 RepID=UPI003AEF46BD